MAVRGWSAGAPRSRRPVRPPRSYLDDWDRPARPPRARRTVQERLRRWLVVASALVLALTGAAWGVYRDVTAGITTTDVIGNGGGDGAQDILLVGVDSRTDARGNPLPPEVLRTLHGGAASGVLNADTIILLHVPKDGGAAVAFSIPRDAYVDIPGHRADKINAAYPATKLRAAEELVAEGVRDQARIEVESAQVGRRSLVETVEALTGVEVDHYAEINLYGFYTLTTAIGGVDVCLNKAVDDDLSGARLPAGPQTIAGADALAFVRQRHGLPEGDLSRIRRQQVFLAAVADKVLSTGTLTDPAAIARLVDVAEQSLVIDQAWDVLAFARQASGIAAGNMEFVTIPTQGIESNSRGSVVVVDRAEVRQFVEHRVAMAEALAEAEAEPTPEAPPPLEVKASHYVVHVRNASGMNGMAARVADRLRTLGFLRGTVDNAEASATSVVLHSGSDEGAEAIAEQLGGLPVDDDDSVPLGHVEVRLGGDFDPAVLGPAPAAPAPAPGPRTGPITAAGVPCID
jgi:LCP family protein required for cell wall assembly